MKELLTYFTELPWVSKLGPTINLHTMAGHAHIDLASLCLGSMVKFYDQPIHVIVHEDGTITDDDVSRFEQFVPDCTFVYKRDADGPVNEYLARYPACRRLRDHLIFGLKIFDIQVLEDRPELSYADCDILFLRPLTKFFTLPPDPKVGGVFMKDTRNAYCLTPPQLIGNPKLRLSDRLGAGLLHFRRNAFDWDLVEWFLAHTEYVVHPYWKEQTAWSALAAATSSHAWPEKWCRAITRPQDLTPELGVAHYVSNYRAYMKYIPIHGGGHSIHEPALRIPTELLVELTRGNFLIDRTKWLAERAIRKFMPSQTQSNTSS
jgi:hypothetical protein